ncbi:MAG: YkgJ family cysteine cluster protein [Desulfosalsimonas sp.]
MTDPEISGRLLLETLSKIYRLYDDYTYSFSLACRKYCADCCTTAVTVTSLEGEMIYESLEPESRQVMLQKLAASADKPRFRPTMTTNLYALLCSRHKEPPEEEYPENPGICPFLENDACSIYSLRPFGCRCMISLHPCRSEGSASIDEFTLTVNTMFLQIIEHLDRDGFSGNLTDVLLRLASREENRETDISTIPNRPIPALMIPPDHRSRIMPLLNTLNHILEKTPAFS